MGCWLAEEGRYRAAAAAAAAMLVELLETREGITEIEQEEEGGAGGGTMQILFRWGGGEGEGRTPGEKASRRERGKSWQFFVDGRARRRGALPF